jgi:hypothetical protein
MPGKFEGASGAIDLATKIIVTLAIPVATFVINHQINVQTQVIKDQSVAFEKGIKLRDMDVELTVKFYDILESKRFACFDENKAPLLNIMIRQHNAHNRIPIDEAQVVQSLLTESLQNPSCRANQDSLLVASFGEGVPRATSAEVRVTGGSRPLASLGNDAVKGAHGKVSAAIRDRRVASADGTDVTASAGLVAANGSAVPAGADGWVAVGRYNGQLGFTNFSVFAPQLENVELTGAIAPDTTLRSRWSVFLRLNTSDTTQGGNPVLGVLTEGTCVKVRSSVPDLRGQTWAAVSLEPSCRSGDYK